MAWTKRDLETARQRSQRNRIDVELSDACGCFACANIFGPKEVKRWIDMERTAVCPHCGVHAVVPRKVCVHVTDKEFLRAMKAHFLPTKLEIAHKLSIWNRVAVEASDKVGCFYCNEVYPASDVVEWCDEGASTALCPRCGVDSVLGEASWAGATNKSFLTEMNERWFEGKSE